jgi:P pilus assembly chaperone PapD
LVIEEIEKMRALTLFTATLVLLGMSAAAQAAVTLTMSATPSTTAASGSITITVVGDSDTEKSFGVFGTIVYDPLLVSPDGGQSQSPMVYGGGNQFTWGQGVFQVNNPNPNTQDSFTAIPGTKSKKMNNKLTAVMTFSTTGVGGTAVFSWLTTTNEYLTFFGLTNAGGASTTIVPEPSTAGLMALGLIGLVIAGRRR